MKNIVEALLIHAVEQENHDEVIDACERMYTQVYRCSEPKTAAALGFDEDDLAYEFDSAITADTLVVCLCNYKGEGDGYAIIADALHLPLYKSGRRDA